MSLPDQEVLDGIKDLIIEITGFKEDDENFTICQRYCLSHVVHHMYPFVSKTTVKNLVNSYVSRFYGHGYFKVSQELDNQVKSFLSNEKLFEKNPQYDIQWCLLSLLSSLSSNLTSIKKLPELLPTDDEENETEDFNWKEYLTKDLPKPDLFLSEDDDELSDDEDEDDDDDEDEDDFVEEEEKEVEEGEEVGENPATNKKDVEIIYDNKILFSNKNSSEIRQKRIEEFLKSRKSERDLCVDIKVRGNLTEKFNHLLYREGIVKKTQLVSEFEMMENILFQLQTGERIFLRKGLNSPALTSLTDETLGNYLNSLQPYFQIVRSFEEFNWELTEAKYPEKNLDDKVSGSKGNQSANVSDVSSSRKIPNVIFMYNSMLRKSLEPFQKELTEIVENLGNYTLLQMERKLQPYYCDLTSLFRLHSLATKNWKKESNWMSSIRILSVLYNSIMDATSVRLSFLYLNFFVQCFQVYLDIIDSWISFLDLIDPNDEFIVVKSGNQGKSENKFSEFEIRPYKTEIENFGVRNVVPLDLISEKMVQVGESLEVLRRLNRYVAQGKETPKETFYQELVKSINEKVRESGKVDSIPKEVKPPRKNRSIFTVKNIGFTLDKDNGGGDYGSEIEKALIGLEEDEDKKKKEKLEPMRAKEEKDKNSTEFAYSVIRNPFYKKTFESIGIKQVHRQLEEAKERFLQDSKEDAVMVIKRPEKDKSGIYPFNKIITEAFHEILERRISGTCSLVKDIVLKECNLAGHLTLFRSILLFNESHLIQPFYLAVFTQPGIWRSAYSLSFHLKECVRSFYKDEANLLSVELMKNGSNRCENVLQAIDAITIDYEVKWPLSLIITPDAMKKYNETFRLAMKLKWAHWALCNQYFERKNEDEKGSKSTRHRLQLLRFWLLSALGRLNNYFLTQMSPPALELNSCNDLKQIIREHTEFLEKVYQNCLLGEKSPEGTKLIQEALLMLCMNVWMEDADVTDEKLSSMEKTFGSCHLALCRLLHSLEK